MFADLLVLSVWVAVCLVSVAIWGWPEAARYVRAMGVPFSSVRWRGLGPQGLILTGIAGWSGLIMAGHWYFSELPGNLVGYGTAFGFTLWSPLLVLVDGRCHRLPNRLNLATAVAVIVGMGVDFFLGNKLPNWYGACLSAVLLAGLFAVGALARLGIGWGDVKLAGVIGLFLGQFSWSASWTGIGLAFVLGGLYTGGLLLSGRVSRHAKIAFGPWLILGASLTWVFLKL